MIVAVARQGGGVGCCGTCSDARGLTDAIRIPGAHRSSMDELTEWTCWADKVITF